MKRKINHRELVKEYLGPFDFVKDIRYFDLVDRLSIAAGHEHPFLAFGKVTDMSGVYAFFDGFGIAGKCLYVGKSVSLYTRMNQHVDGKNVWWKKYDADVEADENMYEAPYIITVGIKFASKEDLTLLEREFIYRLKPKYNVV